jgi:hypothetical protein
MKRISVKTVFLFIILLAGFGSLQMINAQTLEEIEKRKALAKAKVGLGTIEMEAEVLEVPCQIYDDDQWYTGANQKKGTPGDPQLANTLLRLTQEQLKQKIKGRYQAVVRDYFDQMDIDGKSSAATHIESAGDHVIDQVLNDTREFCRKQSKVDDSGNITMYMSIKISKKDLTEKIVEGISEDKQAKVRFNEQKFRESALKVFQEKEEEKE